MIGRTFSHYRIQKPLGAGGMGEVYLARDEHLDRDVAVKVLPAASLADESARRRFRQEALALSRFNHPHIATIYDFDSEGGTDFLIMEYVEGRSLAEELAAGPLAEPRAAALAAQVAEALAAAHERGLVHRDLKPANVMVMPGDRVKVLDFGLAKLIGPVSEAHAHTLTTTGAAPGTLPYMAPEQLLGLPVDGRTDIFALGVMLFELTTGRRPFDETLATALVYRIVNDAASRPSNLRPGLSADLDRVVLKCLEKRPEARYPGARELIGDLRALGSAGREAVAGVGPGFGGSGAGLRDESSSGAGPRGGIRSLAVLPLRNLSGEPEQEYFADGMTEALISDLAQIGALRVISRTSAMQYKGAHQPLPEVARALNVDAIVEGSALKAGPRVRISAQLIEAATDRCLWARSYDRDLGDILSLQSEVAREIAREIRIKLTPQEKARLANETVVNPEAHVAYLKGRFQWNKWTPEGFRASIRLFEQAIGVDPLYTPAYAGLADSYSVLGNTNVLSPREAYEKAKAAALAGLAIQEQSAELHASLGYVRWFCDWDWPAAETEFRRAIELNPGYATALRWCAQFLSAMGRHDEAVAQARRALDLDPLALIIYTAVGDVLFYARRYDEAILYYRKSLEMDPDFVPGHTDMARACEQNGMLEEAEKEYERALTLTGGRRDTSAGLAHVYARQGRREEARGILENLKAQSARQYVSAFAVASIHASLGQNDAAFEWLEKAYAAQDGALALLKVHPRLDGLRPDPRYADLLRRMRLGD